MTSVYVILSIVLLAIVLSRRVDLLSIASVCLIVYNWYCSVGRVWIASHEKAGVNYYEGVIDERVYFIVLSQIVVMIAVVLLYDLKRRRDVSVDGFSGVKSKYSDSQLRTIFKFAGIVSMLIMLSNVASIGVSGLSAEKSEVWAQTNVLYVSGLWLSMAVFTYAFKTKQYGFLFLSLPQILIHLFIGSRAYFAVVCIVALVCISSASNRFSLKRNVIILIVGFVMMMGIMLYKQIFEEVKAGDIDQIITILQSPDTYNWIFRWGEPRIVLANFNYVVETGLSLDAEQIVGRIITVIPFLNNFISINEHDLLLSTIVGGDLNSSYGLASNIWGEFYAIGSYPFVAIMYAIWISLLIWGNKLIQRNEWTSSFWIPLIAYYGFYIHRMDLVKVLGNAKMLIFAMLIWWILACLVTKNISIGKPKMLNSNISMPDASKGQLIKRAERKCDFRTDCTKCSAMIKTKEDRWRLHKIRRHLYAIPQRYFDLLYSRSVYSL